MFFGNEAGCLMDYVIYMGSFMFFRERGGLPYGLCNLHELFQVCPGVRKVVFGFLYHTWDISCLTGSKEGCLMDYVTYMGYFIFIRE